MAKKLSKSDLDTPEMRARIALADETFYSQRCKHFERGTKVVMLNRTGLIVDRRPDSLLILTDTGFEVIKPYALGA